MGFLNAVQGVLTIMLMILLGYMLCRRGVIDGDGAGLISRLVSGIAIPAYMISNVLSTYDREMLMELKDGLVNPFVSIALSMLTAFLVQHFLKIDNNRKGTFCSMFSLANSIFVGLPVNLALFGEESVPYVLLYFTANTSFFWTLGVYGISRDGEASSKNITALERIKKILSPPLVAFFFSMGCVLLEIKLPKTIMDTAKYIGGMSTPLSMIFIGCIMYSVKPKQVKFDIGMAAVLAGRFIVSPLLVMLVSLVFPIPLFMKKIFIIQSAMPVMTQTSILTKTYGADTEYTAYVTTISTIMSLIFIPIYMVILNSSFFV